jgi:hypothetical protein
MSDVVKYIEISPNINEVFIAFTLLDPEDNAIDLDVGRISVYSTLYDAMTTTQAEFDQFADRCDHLREVMEWHSDGTGGAVANTRADRHAIIRLPLKEGRVLPCVECNRETEISRNPGHYYMLRDELWASIIPDTKGILCISCVEHRLGRSLTDEDFTLSPTDMMKRYNIV